MTDEETELYAEEETPAEEKPLDCNPPVTCFVPIDYFFHDLTKILVIMKDENDFDQKNGLLKNDLTERC